MRLHAVDEGNVSGGGPCKTVKFQLSSETITDFYLFFEKLYLCKLFPKEWERNKKSVQLKWVPPREPVKIRASMQCLIPEWDADLEFRISRVRTVYYVRRWLWTASR